MAIDFRVGRRSEKQNLRSPSPLLEVALVDRNEAKTPVAIPEAVVAEKWLALRASESLTPTLPATSREQVLLCASGSRRSMIEKPESLRFGLKDWSYGSGQVPVFSGPQLAAFNPLILVPQSATTR